MAADEKRRVRYSEIQGPLSPSVRARGTWSDLTWELHPGATWKSESRNPPSLRGTAGVCGLGSDSSFSGEGRGDFGFRGRPSQPDEAQGGKGCRIHSLSSPSSISLSTPLIYPLSASLCSLILCVSLCPCRCVVCECSTRAGVCLSAYVWVGRYIMCRYLHLFPVLGGSVCDRAPLF